MGQDNFDKMHKRISDRRRYAQDKYDSLKMEEYKDKGLQTQLLTEFVVLNSIWIEMNEMKNSTRY